MTVILACIIFLAVLGIFGAVIALTPPTEDSLIVCPTCKTTKLFTTGTVESWSLPMECENGHQFRVNVKVPEQ